MRAICRPTALTCSRLPCCAISQTARRQSRQSSRARAARFRCSRMPMRRIWDLWARHRAVRWTMAPLSILAVVRPRLPLLKMASTLRVRVCRRGRFLHTSVSWATFCPPKTRFRPFARAFAGLLPPTKRAPVLARPKNSTVSVAPFARFRK